MWFYVCDSKHPANMPAAAAAAAAVNSKHNSSSGCTPKAKDSAQREAFDWEGGPSIDGLLK